MNVETRTVDLGLAQAGLDTGCRDCVGSQGGCGSGGACGCGEGMLERPHWFAGQLVGPADLEALQQWVLGRARRHNRMVHGWGVSCGLGVEPTSTEEQDPVPWSVTISPGLALSACGDDICLASAVRIDIRQPSLTSSDVCAAPVDPWCAPVRQRRDPDRTYYLAIRYAEEQRRPVRGAACGCACEGDPCEYSRIAESWDFAVLDALPDCYDEDAGMLDPAEAGGLGCTREISARGTRQGRACCQPWVVLADLRVTAAGVVLVDQLAHRRFLAQLGEHAFFCAEPPVEKPRIGFTLPQKETLAHLFSSGSAVVDSDEPNAVLAAPAVSLKGAKATSALKRLLADRSVAEVAGAGVEGLEAEAISEGVDREALGRIVDSARLAALIARP